MRHNDDVKSGDGDRMKKRIFIYWKKSVNTKCYMGDDKKYIYIYITTSNNKYFHRLSLLRYIHRMQLSTIFPVCMLIQSHCLIRVFRMSVWLLLCFSFAHFICLSLVGFFFLLRDLCDMRQNHFEWKKSFHSTIEATMLKFIFWKWILSFFVFALHSFCYIFSVYLIADIVDP